jgi:ribonucleoside-diphosphate reductase alpha chain
MVAKDLDTQKYGLLPTPPIPADLPPIELTDNARQVLVRRYVRRGDDGKPVESVEEMFWRVAYHVAKVEEAWGGDVLERAHHFYTLLTSKKFFPNSPTFTGAGTPLGQLAACFVLPISDDMGRDEAGIFQSLRNAALIQQTGGGNGFSFSRLRPAGGLVKSSAGQATGPVGFLRVYDNAFGEIAQGGTRRGANMGVLRVDHPDVDDFITCKTNENAITNFNISVGITDAFMQAVQDDADWDLVFPDIASPEYRSFRGTIEQAREQGIPIRVYKTVRARELFDKIVQQAHHNGEPGVLFLDAANRSNPVPHLYPLESTNPCFVGSTRIATDQGMLKIEELANSGAELLVATDGRAPLGGDGQSGPVGGVSYRPASPAWKTRENVQTYTLITKHGYLVTATPDHKFLTKMRGYVELSSLQPGETLLLQSGQGVWSKNFRLPNLESLREKFLSMAQAGDRASGNLVQRKDFADQYANLPENWSHELGVILGTLLGDGWLSPTSNSPVGMVFNSGDDELLDIVHGNLRSWFGEGHLHERSAVRQLTYGRLPYEFFVSLGVVASRAHEKRVPESLWQAPRQAVVGFLQALFTTDGTVNLSAHKKSCSIRLASASLELLRDVQLLLLNFGIVSRIHTRRPDGMRLLPDGHGGKKEYFTHADYELLIDKANRDEFAREIGFLNAEKQQKVLEFIRTKTRLSNRESFETIVLSVEPAGVADVYDLTEPQTHSVIANGIVAHQCGEQWLGPFENCCLGSVNLAQHFGENGTVDWNSLRESVELSTRFLDDVVEANAYVPAVPQLREAAHRARRIGLGIMGLADLMYHVGVRYGSPEGQEFASVVMEFVRYHSMKTSIDMAAERGPFPAIEGSIYDPDNLKWRAPQSIIPITQTWERPALNWDEIISEIKRHGIRNAAQTTVAPTGTIATVAGCEGYGCEPVFALAYIRHVNDNGKDLQLTYGSPLFEKALQNAGLDHDARQSIFESVMNHGTCQDVDEVPEQVRRIFATAGDVTAEEHVRMAGALQAFVDNSISKTINFPEGASEVDVAHAYMLAWELGAKGITVYVTGSRDKVVLETKATLNKKQGLEAPTPNDADKSSSGEPDIWHATKKQRPRALRGQTFNINTPLGKAFITVNENGGDQPFEVFINTSKAGSDTAAVSEAIGRLISYILRLASPVAPLDRMREVVAQLAGIGGGRSLGFGPNRVRSLPDGVGQVLDEYLLNRTDPRDIIDSGGNGHNPAVSGPQTTSPMMKIGDLCPECGQAAVVNEEGCRKCYACGYSEC